MALFILGMICGASLMYLAIVLLEPGKELGSNQVCQVVKAGSGSSTVQVNGCSIEVKDGGRDITIKREL